MLFYNKLSSSLILNVVLLIIIITLTSELNYLLNILNDYSLLL